MELLSHTQVCGGSCIWPVRWEGLAWVGSYRVMLRGSDTKPVAAGQGIFSFHSPAGERSRECAEWGRE